MMSKVLGSIMCVGLLLGAAPAAATEGEWTLRFGAPWVDSGPDLRFTEEGSTIELAGQTGFGLGLSIERRMSDRLGWEFGATWTRSDVELRFSDPLFGTFVASDEMSPITLTAGPDIHLTPDSRADVYVGPLVAWVLNNDVAFSLLGETLDVKVDNNFAWGAVLGLDYPMGSEGWYFCGSVRYLESEADAAPADDPSDTDSLAIDPLMVAVGFGYRF